MSRTNLALGLSAAAIIIAAYAAFKPSPQNMPTPSSSHGGELAEVKAQMMVLQRALARNEAASVYSTAGIQNDTTDVNPELAKAPTNSEIVSFSTPSGLRIKADTKGVISVSNSDKALTGKTMMIQAQHADGTAENISITVPAPAQ